MTAVAPPLAPGRELAPGLIVIEHLSRNQALDVYDAWDAGRYCRVVAKTLRPDRARDERAIGRLRQEGLLLAGFTHPHIVRAYETLEAPRTIVVLETLDGETLSFLVNRRVRRLAAAEVALLGLHVASALRYLHGKGWVHIDVKPANVILDQGLAKLLDLSLACRPTTDARPGAGTRGYLAPEQARGGALSAATDVWGLGAMLFEAATGDVPFAEGEPGYAQLRRRAVPVRRLRRVPVALGHAIDACLEPDAERRPPLDAVIANLEPMVAG
jgi:eukaryotic-like serine/threonine-protein kinase